MRCIILPADSSNSVLWHVSELVFFFICQTQGTELLSECLAEAIVDVIVAFIM